MSLATSHSQLLEVLESVAGVGQVHGEPLTDKDRDVLHEKMVDAGGRLNYWEVAVFTEQFHDGSDGMLRDELEFEITAHYVKSPGSRMQLVETLRDVGRAIMATAPDNGFTNIKPPGVVVREQPTEFRTRTDHECLRARLAFRTWDELGGPHP